MGTELTERAIDTSQPHDVFVSYARQDQAFVRRLTEALAERGKRAWVDWADIPPTAEWMAEIRAAIDAADTYVVVLSPSSIGSKVCAAELDAALTANKRIVPVLAVPVPDDTVPAEVAKLNWVVFTDGFDPALEKLLAALDTDLDHVKAHTQLQVKAREWESKNESRSLLLRGAELKESEAFLVRAQAKDPRPTAMQARFLQASRAAATRRQRGTITGVTAMFLVAALFAGVAVQQRGVAINQRAIAVQQANVARSRELAISSIQQLDHDPELSLLLAIEAARTDTTPQAADALRQALLASGATRTYQVDAPDRAFATVSYGAHTVAYSPDGDLMAVVNYDTGQLVTWDTQTGSVVSTITTPGRPLSVVFSPDGRMVAASLDLIDRRNHLNGEGIWDVQTGKKIELLPDSTNLMGGAFSPDGTEIATIDGRGAARVWDVATGRVVTELTSSRRDRLEELNGGDIAYSPDGDTIAVAGDGLALFQARSGRHLATLMSRATVNSVSFSTDGSQVIAATYGEGAETWDVATGFPLVTLPHVGPLTGAAFIAGTRYAVTSDGTVWDALFATPAGKLLAPDLGVLLVAPDGTSVTTVSHDGSVTAFGPVPGMSLLDIHDRTDPSGDSAEASPDGTGIAIGLLNGPAGVWDASTGRRLLSLEGPSDNTASYSPDGRTIEVTTLTSIRFLDASTGAVLAVGRNERPTKIQFNGNGGGFSSDGTRFVSVSYGKGSAEVWDVRTGRLIASYTDTIAGSSGNAFIDAAIRPHGTQVYLAHGHDVVVWDPATGKAVRTWRGAQADISGLSFSPDGSRLAVASDDGTVHVWETDSAQQVATMDSGTRGINSVRFSWDGRFLVLATGGSVQVWTADGTRVEEFHAAGYVPEASFSPDGTRIVVSDSDTTFTAVSVGLDFVATPIIARVYPCMVCVGFDRLISLAESRATRTMTPQEKATYAIAP